MTFRCRFCGEYFELSKDEQTDYENGFYAVDPDCCDECLKMQDYVPDYDDTFDN